MINLWDKLPTELTYEIMKYNKLPYLDEVKEHYRVIWYGNTHFVFRTQQMYVDMSVRLDHKFACRMSRALYGKTFYPCREDVIKLMKNNNLRIRKGMKTRTMIKHLIKM